jgi:hypothetical protein
MQKAAQERLSADPAKKLYFIAPEAALAAIIADEAASIADDAAIAADDAASEAAAIVGAAIVAGAGAAGAGASSFLLQAAKETAAASVAISNAVFILLLDLKVRTMTGNCGNPLVEGPHRVRRQGTHEHSSA